MFLFWVFRKIHFSQWHLKDRGDSIVLISLLLFSSQSDRGTRQREPRRANQERGSDTRAYEPTPAMASIFPSLDYIADTNKESWSKTHEHNKPSPPFRSCQELYIERFHATYFRADVSPDDAMLMNFGLYLFVHRGGVFLLARVLLRRGAGARGVDSSEVKMARVNAAGSDARKRIKGRNKQGRHGYMHPKYVLGGTYWVLSLTEPLAMLLRFTKTLRNDVNC